MAAEVLPSPFYRVLAALLDYPGEGFAEILGEAEQFLCSHFDPRPAYADQALSATVWMRSQGSLTLQETYVRTFDLSPDNALHLTAHLLDEHDRRRGPALIKLVQHYRTAGLRITNGELPDYLPAILEFASTLEPAAAAQFLSGADASLSVLERNLHSAGSPYASLICASRLAARPHGASAPAVAAGAAS